MRAEDSVGAASAIAAAQLHPRAASELLATTGDAFTQAMGIGLLVAVSPPPWPWSSFASCLPGSRSRPKPSLPASRSPTSRSVDSEVRELLERWAATPATPVGELTAKAVREDDMAVLELQRRPGELYSVEDIEATGPAGTLPVRVYRPRPGRLPSLLFLHGGGFVIGRAGYDAPLRELALASGCMILAPECRLAPEHPFPAAVDDALAVARWLADEAPALRAPTRPPGIAGDSSGGNLAATVTHALTRQGTPPSFQLLVYPMLDATASSASYDEFAEGYGFVEREITVVLR